MIHPWIAFAVGLFFGLAIGWLLTRDRSDGYDD